MVILYPLDTLSVRLSVTKNVYKNIGDAFRRTVTLETPRALFSGEISPSTCCASAGPLLRCSCPPLP